MITVKGYNWVDYETFISNIFDAYKRSGKTYMDIAYSIGVNSTQTIGNVMRTDKQIVSDEILTKVMSQLNVFGFINWEEGEKYYYLKNGKQ